MEDNAMKTVTETREDDSGGAVGMRDNEDGRQGNRRRWQRTSTVAEMRDNNDGYGVRGYPGRKQKRCGTTEMKKWVGIKATDWGNIDREQLPTCKCIVTLIN